jgi:acetylornithine/succinyldiaminopimelate/putrescine aminotransferase
VLAKDTHGSTIRLAPPLVISAAEVDFAVDTLAAALAELKHEQSADGLPDRDNSERVVG